MNLRQRIAAATRAFRLGQGLDPGDVAFGVDASTYSPSEYGNYLATSNAVYTCATLRASMLSSLPLALYRTQANGDRKEVTNGSLRDLMDKVNPFWTRSRLIEMSELSLCLWGACYWFLERGKAGTGEPKEIWWGRPDRVRVFPHPTEYIGAYTYSAPNGEVLPYLPSEVISFRYSNPMDEFSGLSPLAAARLSADVGSAALKSNRNLFAQGMQAGGFVVPKSGAQFTQEQAKDIESFLAKKLRGVDNAHRWSVFRFDAEIKSPNVSPKDAEFLGALKWTLEDVARAYKVPLDLIGGQRTYANLAEAHKAIWTMCLLPEAQFIATELTEQLLPMFGQADTAEFDSSDVDVLHEDEAARWTRAQEQIAAGAITVNEWRAEEGMEPVPWGDVWWASGSMTPIKDATEKPEPAPDETPTTDEEPDDEQPGTGAESTQSAKSSHTRAIGYDSPEHRLLWNRFVRQADRWERLLALVVVALFKRQQDSILSKLAMIITAGEALEPFDLVAWVRVFVKDTMKPITDILQEAGDEALSGIGLSVAFDVKSPLVNEFIKGRVQRFAERVNETTWTQLKGTLSEGITAGESIPVLEQRVVQVMGNRIQSTPEVIARTEIIGASNGGTLLAWIGSEVVGGKTWISALDERVRTPEKGDEFDHLGAHGETVPLDQPFIKTGEPLAFPGADGGSASNIIQCRCTMAAVLKK